MLDDFKPMIDQLRRDAANAAGHPAAAWAWSLNRETGVIVLFGSDPTGRAFTIPMTRQELRQFLAQGQALLDTRVP